MLKVFRAILAALIAINVLILLLYIGLRLGVSDQLWWLALLNNFAPYYFFPLPLLAAGAALARLPRRYTLAPLAVLLVGLAWLAPRFLPTGSAAAAAAGPVLKVITFNHWMEHPDLEAIGEWLEAEAADVVVLQQAYRRLSSLVEEDYPYFAFDGPRENWSGRLILSRYPIAESEAIPLTPERDRGLQRTVIEVRGQPVTIYNVHLSQPQREGPRFRIGRLRFPLSFIAQYDEVERNTQIRLLLEQIAAETGPTIVAGDFNTSDNAVIYDEMAAVMQDSYRQAASGLGATWPVAKLRGVPGLLPPLLRIDYIWHRGGFHTLSASIGPRLGSDHLPVVATLQLDPDESAD